MISEFQKWMKFCYPPQVACACTYSLCPPMTLSPSTATHHSMVKLTLWNQDKAFTCHSASEHDHATMSGPCQTQWPPSLAINRPCWENGRCTDAHNNQQKKTMQDSNHRPPSREQAPLHHTITEIYHYIRRCEKCDERVLPPNIDGPSHDRIPSTTPGAEPPRDARDSGSARSHSTHLETSSSDRP